MYYLKIIFMNNVYKLCTARAPKGLPLFHKNTFTPTFELR